MVASIPPFYRIRKGRIEILPLPEFYTGMLSLKAPAPATAGSTSKAAQLVSGQPAEVARDEDILMIDVIDRDSSSKTIAQDHVEKAEGRQIHILTPRARSRPSRNGSAKGYGQRADESLAKLQRMRACSKGFGQRADESLAHEQHVRRTYASRLARKFAPKRSPVQQSRVRDEDYIPMKKRVFPQAELQEQQPAPPTEQHQQQTQDEAGAVATAGVVPQAPVHQPETKVNKSMETLAESGAATDNNLKLQNTEHPDDKQAPPAIGRELPPIEKPTLKRKAEETKSDPTASDQAAQDTTIAPESRPKKRAKTAALVTIAEEQPTAQPKSTVKLPASIIATTIHPLQTPAAAGDPKPKKKIKNIAPISAREKPPTAQLMSSDPSRDIQPPQTTTSVRDPKPSKKPKVKNAAHLSPIAPQHTSPLQNSPTPPTSSPAPKNPPTQTTPAAVPEPKPSKPTGRKPKPLSWDNTMATKTLVSKYKKVDVLRLLKDEGVDTSALEGRTAAVVAEAFVKQRDARAAMHKARAEAQECASKKRGREDNADGGGVKKMKSGGV
ncbi:hypothetical protein BU26DRAFT_594656 [Trematosphaeria pertusa]|uniref:Uncharacterized protein n=1 Tax=Trematosphaeria pertusa TaxID=390896 RepID=A0A6A6IG96_9PLEO|nr:uncharacterized protein BU26DRAFT_594656 [Trematosphaeria pertusa]KAF2248932.1 hypothetical protein BU26DRAFT_594656 [Trematosphaeria pertusa]